jgi:hypothetical protein
MLKNRFIIVFCFFSTLLAGQNNPYHKDIIAIYDTIIAATHRGDWDKVLNHTYPKLFEIAPREQIVELISKTFTDTSVMKVSIAKGQADSLSNDTLLVGNELFVLLYDSKQMHIVLTEVLSEPDKDNKVFISMIQGYFENSYGKENVQYDAEKASFDIIKKKGINICSNMSPLREKDKWTLMEVKDDNPQLLKMLLPEQVLDWIKAH